MRPVDLQKLQEVVTPVVEGQGYELVDVEWKHEHGQWILRVFIDRRAGATDPKISVDDCANVSHELSAVLDVSDVIAPAYSLEVSSPGLDRALKKEADYIRFHGEEAQLKLREPIGNARRVKGVLRGVEAGVLRLETADGTHAIPLANIDKARLIPRIEWRNAK
jgi:ribosome maturation factor RimP